MAERDFEEKAAKLREARDIYMEEGEEGGVEAIGIVPGAPGARSGRGRRVEDEVKDQRNLLRGIREDVQELRKVVSELKGGLVETSEALKEFYKGFSQIGREFQEFYKSFGQFVKEFSKFQQDFSLLGKGLRGEFGKLLGQVGSLGKVPGILVKEYKAGVGELLKVNKEVRKVIRVLDRVSAKELLRASNKVGDVFEQVTRELSEVEKAILVAKLRKRQIEQQGRKQKGGYEYSRLGGGGLKVPKFPGPIVLQEQPRMPVLFRRYSDAYMRMGYGWRDDEEEKFQLSVWKWAKSAPVRLLFGASGKGRYGRYGGGGMLGEARNIMYAALGPIGVHVQEWMEGLYEKWLGWKEYKKRKEEERLAELASRGIYKVRQIDRGKKGFFSEVFDFAKALLGFGPMGKDKNKAGGGLFDWMRKGGVVVSAVGGGGGQGRGFVFRGSGGGLGKVMGLLESGGRERRFDKVSLSDVELVQERDAKIYADKLYIEAKQVSGVGGGSGILDMLPGGGLLGKIGRLGRFGRWVGRIGLGVGVGLAFLSGVREGGLGQGIFKGLGALGGGIVGMKLGALGGAKLGALIGSIVPGAGTAVGAALGGLLGGALGMFGGEKIADAVYSGMKKLVKDKDWVESLGKGFEGVVDRIGDLLKSVIEGVKAGIGAVGSAAGKAWGWVKEKGGGILQGVREDAEKFWEYAKKGMSDAFGFVSRVFEVGDAYAADLTKAASVVGYTPGDPGGMSFGMYQLSDPKMIEKFLKQYGYWEEFKGIPLKSEAGKRKWQELAKREGVKFARAQQEFVMKEYYAPGAVIAKRYGIDVNRSKALREMVIARTVQQGTTRFDRVLRNAFRGMTPEQLKAMLPEEIITRVYDHLIANVDKYWASSAPKVREGVRKRLIKEKELLLAIEKQKKGVQGQADKSKQVSYPVEDGIVIDDGLLTYQQEVARRVIAFDVRKEMDVFSSVKDGLEKVLSTVVGKVGGGTQRLVMSGGDAFSKVPLFPEDMGLVMMMLGLV